MDLQLYSHDSFSKILRTFFVKKLIPYKTNVHKKTNSFLLCMDLQPYSHDCFSKISRTLFDFLNNTYWVSFFQRNNLLIFWTGFPVSRNTLLLYSLSPNSQTERLTESQIHSLRVGWRNLFSSCAVVSVFGSGRKLVLVLHTTYVLRVPFSCGVVLVFLVLAGNSFWCYVRTQCTIQLCGCVSFVVVAGKLIQYEFSC